jgi:Na+-translocating ferredoxin:NAD+ oxidoreductase subunit A
MNFHALLQLVISSMLINNIVFTLMIGVCPLCGASQRLSQSAWMGITITIVMGISSTVSWMFSQYVLAPHSLLYLQTMVFIIIIVSLVQLFELALEKLWPFFYESIGDYLPVITTNCAVLAVCLLSAGTNPVTGHPFTFVEAFVNGVATGLGFMLAVILMSGIRRRLELSEVPAPLKGLPIMFLSAGLMSLAFLGFSGLSVTALFSGIAP